MYKRHDMLILSDDGRAFAYGEALVRNKGISGELLYEMIVTDKAPAIVKRQSGYTGEYLEVGFTSRRIADGVRIKAQTLVAVCFIEEVITPYQVAGRLEQTDERVGAVIHIARQAGVKAGVLGSTAMAALTGLPYVNENSDLDMVVFSRRFEDILKFRDNITGEPLLQGCELDVELDIGSGYFVKLDEFLSEQATVLAKGFRDARLFDLSDVKSVFSRCFGDVAAKNAVKALLYEAAVTPKPGLVDMNNNGSHEDMDFFTLIDSATALTPHFRRFFDIGGSGKNPRDVFERLRFPGMLAEDDMLAATGGVNTHKGAIFSLGILCAAIGFLYSSEGVFDSGKVFDICAAMSSHALARELRAIKPDSAATFGERAFAYGGIAGARGEAISGFRSVRDIGLPVFRIELDRGKSFNDAAVATLLRLISCTRDTNMIKRGGMDMQEYIRERVRDLLESGDYSEDSLLSLDDWFIDENLSPGGSADLLAATLMMYFMDEDVSIE